MARLSRAERFLCLFTEVRSGEGGTWRPVLVPETADVLVALEREQRVQVSVFDLAGHRIRNLLREDRGPGEHAIVWDGRNEQGRRMPSSGVYPWTSPEVSEVIFP